MENIGRQRKSRIPDVSQVCVTLFELDGNFWQAAQSYPLVLTYDGQVIC